MGMSNYPNGFKDGIMLRGLPLQVTHPGKIFFVNNSSVLPANSITPSDANKGGYLDACSTIDGAIGKCVANRGDIIMVMPGHAETLDGASAIDLDVAGVALIGLGHGSLRPVLTYDTSTDTVAIGADNCSIINIEFRASVTGVVDGLIIEDGVDHALVKDCVFSVDAAGTDEFLDCISLVNNNSRCVIEDCVIDMGIAGAVSGIHMDADTAYLEIRNCKIRGDFSTANILGDTTLSTNILIEDCLLENGIGGDLGSEPGIELLTGTTGTIRRNDIVCNLATKAASIVADTCLLFENYYNEDISGAATGGIIGAASADDA